MLINCGGIILRNSSVQTFNARELLHDFKIHIRVVFVLLIFSDQFESLLGSLIGTIGAWCKKIFLRWMIRLLFKHRDIFFCRNAVLYLTYIINLPDYVNKH